VPYPTSDIGAVLICVKFKLYYYAVSRPIKFSPTICAVMFKFCNGGKVILGLGLYANFFSSLLTMSARSNIEHCL